MCSQCAKKNTNDSPVTARVPPLLAMVKNELYAGYYNEKEVWKYDEQRNMCITIGRLPERATSIYGWGLGIQGLW